MNEASEERDMEAEQEAWTIKPLEWTRTTSRSGERFHKNDTIFGRLSVLEDFERDLSSSYRWRYDFEEYYDQGEESCDSMEDGEAKAEAFYRERLSPALAPSLALRSSNEERDRLKAAYSKLTEEAGKIIDGVDEAIVLADTLADFIADCSENVVSHTNIQEQANNVVARLAEITKPNDRPWEDFKSFWGITGSNEVSGEDE